MQFTKLMEFSADFRLSPKINELAFTAKNLHDLKMVALE